MEESEVRRIVKLYKEGKSIDEVAEETGWHRSTVYRKVKNAGEVKSLSEAKSGTTLSEEHKRKISEGCKANPNVGSDSRPLKESHNKMDKKLTYVYGVLITDGYISDQGIGLETIDKEFCDRFQEFAEEKFGVEGRRYNGKERKNEIRGDKFTSQETEIFRLNSVNLLEHLEDVNIIEELKKLEDRELQIEALKGMWDSDGSLNVEGRQVVFYKSDESIIDLYTSLISDLIEADYNVIDKKRTKVCKFGTKKSVKKFYEIVDPTIERKREKLEKMID